MGRPAMSVSRRIGMVRARHARQTARLWWVGAALLAGSFAVSTIITTASLDEPGPTTLPPVITQPSTTGRASSTLPGSTGPGAPPAPGPPGAQGPAGPAGSIVAMPPPTTV